MTGYGLRHGEAVAVGLALDLTYASRMGLLAPDLRQRIVQLLRQLGLPTAHPRLASPDLLLGLEHFRRHLGGPLQLPLIRDVGRPITLDRVDKSAVLAAARQLLDESAGDLN
jgi:3-dehydroquinate synthase